jgi:hypothetical protein
MIDIAGVNLDLTITMGNIIEIAVLVGGGVMAVSKFTTKFALFHADLTNVKTDVGDMKEDIKKVNELLVKTAENDRRIGRIEDVVYGWAAGHARHSADGVPG